MKSPTLKQKVKMYEDFLHTINTFLTSGCHTGIQELIANADNWSYSHRCGEFVTDNKRQQTINNAFWKLLDTPKSDKETKERQAKYSKNES
jgi:hypothetical protein